MENFDATLNNYETYLNDLGYPGIVGKHNMKTIFGEENRISLLSWMLLKLYVEYESEFKTTTNLPEAISNALRRCGFVLPSEAKIMMKGIDQDTEIQTKVFDRIFRMLALTLEDTYDNTKDSAVHEEFVFAKLTKIQEDQSSNNTFKNKCTIDYATCLEEFDLSSIEEEIEMVKEEINETEVVRAELKKSVENVPDRSNEMTRLQERLTHMLTTLNSSLPAVPPDLNVSEMREKLEKTERMGKNVSKFAGNLRIIVNALEKTLLLKKILKQEITSKSNMENIEKVSQILSRNLIRSELALKAKHEAREKDMFFKTEWRIGPKVKGNGNKNENNKIRNISNLKDKIKKPEAQNAIQIGKQVRFRFTRDEINRLKSKRIESPSEFQYLSGRREKYVKLTAEEIQEQDNTQNENENKDLDESKQGNEDTIEIKKPQ